MHEEGRVEKRETRTFSVMKVRAERSSKQTWMSRLDFLWRVESSVKSITATKWERKEKEIDKEALDYLHDVSLPYVCYYHDINI